MTILNKPIDVSSTFDSAGIISPYRFKMITDDKSETIFEIKRLLRRDKEKTGPETYIYAFTCELVINEEKVLCDLKFDVQTSKWTLYRM